MIGWLQMATRFAWTLTKLTIVVIAVIVIVALAAAVSSRYRDPSNVPAGVGVAVPNGSPQESARSQAIVAVKDPRGEVARRVAGQSGACVVTIQRLQHVDLADLDRRVAALTSIPGWLERDRMWVGEDEGEAVQAFGASWAGKAPDAAGNVWIEITRDDQPVGLELRAVRTERGHTVWRVADSVARSDRCLESR